MNRMLNGGAAVALFAVAMTIVPASAGDSAASESRSAAEAPAIALWAALDDAWNARDAAKFTQLFTDDASLRFVDRDYSLEGRAALLRHFTDQFARQTSDLRHASSLRDARLIASDLIGVDADIAILRLDADAGSEPAIVRRFEVFALMSQSADGWRFQMLRAYRLRTEP
jgi:uncharacterized protein (TIGR02246 family)